MGGVEECALCTCKSQFGPHACAVVSLKTADEKVTIAFICIGIAIKNEYLTSNRYHSHHHHIIAVIIGWVASWELLQHVAWHVDATF